MQQGGYYPAQEAFRRPPWGYDQPPPAHGAQPQQYQPYPARPPPVYYAQPQQQPQHQQQRQRQRQQAYRSPSPEYRAPNPGPRPQTPIIRTISPSDRRRPPAYPEPPAVHIPTERHRRGAEPIDDSDNETVRAPAPRRTNTGGSSSRRRAEPTVNGEWGFEGDPRAQESFLRGEAELRRRRRAEHSARPEAGPSTSRRQREREQPQPAYSVSEPETNPDPAPDPVRPRPSRESASTSASARQVMWAPMPPGWDERYYMGVRRSGRG